jgi:hypothetical protein
VAIADIEIATNSAQQTKICFMMLSRVRTFDSERIQDRTVRDVTNITPVGKLPELRACCRAQTSFAHLMSSKEKAPPTSGEALGRNWGMIYAIPAIL